MPPPRPDTIPVSRARNHPAGRLLALSTGVLLQGYAGWGLWRSHPVPIPLWFAAATVGALAFAWGLADWNTPHGAGEFTLYSTLCIFLPFYGLLGCVIMPMYLRRARGDRLTAQLDELQWDEVSNPESGPPAGPLTGQVIRSVDQMVRHELSVQSYADIIRGSDRTLKKALIGRILSEWTPNAVTLLQEGLSDPDYEIRSYASTALTAIENRMSTRIQRLRREQQQTPGDISAALSLARSYLDYATSGLLDSSSMRHYATLANRILEQLRVADHPDHDRWLDVMTVRGHIARLQDDRETEDQVYRSILDHHPGHHDTLGHYCNLLLRERRFAELKSTAARFLRHTVSDHPALAAARIWAEPAAQGGTS